MGPDGIQVEAVELRPVNVVYARRWHSDAAVGQVWFLVARRGRLVGYCRDIEEVGEVVDLAQLRAPVSAPEDAR